MQRYVIQTPWHGLDPLYLPYPSTAIQPPEDQTSLSQDVSLSAGARKTKEE